MTEVIDMQAQTLRNRSFASLVMALVAAGILLLVGAGGYAIRALTAIAGPSTRVTYVESTAAPGVSNETTRASKR